MTGKLDKNGLWEGSRMMLPEHREQIIQRRHELFKRMPPAMDEYTMQECLQLLKKAMREGREVRLNVREEGQREEQYIEVTGIVRRIDPLLGRIKLFHDHQRTWISFKDIVDVTLMGGEGEDI